MKLEIYHNKQLVNTITNQQVIIDNLLSYLWSKAIYKKGKHHYKYNYNDKQTLTIYHDNNYKYVIKNIPTSWGSLETYNILTELKNEITKENNED